MTKQENRVRCHISKINLPISGGDRTSISFDRMRTTNRKAVYSAIRKRSGLARVDLADLVRLTRPTVSDIVAELIAEGWVREVGVGIGGVGRRPLLLQCVPDARLTVGVDVGINRIRCGVMDLTGALLTCVEAPLTDLSPEAVIDEICAGVTQVIATVESSRLLGVGVGLHGLVDNLTGMSRFAPHLGWREVPIGALLSARLGMQVEVENDVRAMAIGQYMFGVGHEVETLVCLSVGIGIGAGIVMNGQPYRGMHGGAGEIGHTKVMPGGLPCRCGGHGCLETLASTLALVERATLRLMQGEKSSLQGSRQLTDQMLIEAALGGDRLAQDLLAEAGHYLGVALANLVNLLNPQIVVIGGGMSGAGDLLLEPMKVSLRQEALDGLTEGLTITTVFHGENAGLIGSAALLLQPAYTGGLI